MLLSRIAESLFWIGRYVERADGTARILDVHLQLLLEDPWIDEDTLTCLIAADPGEEGAVGQELSPAAQAGVFEAWARAQEHIYVQWSALADWANLQPKIEKALREAVELVWDFIEIAESAHGLEVQGDLVARLNGRWERAVVKAVRDIVRNDERTPRQRVDDLLGFVTETGLPLPEQPTPLPAVRREDIRVICWMAVTPETGPREDGEFPT